eukprot:7638271-Alexandrium_andersonii.AAC.1
MDADFDFGQECTARGWFQQRQSIVLRVCVLPHCDRYVVLRTATRICCDLVNGLQAPLPPPNNRTTRTGSSASRVAEHHCSIGRPQRWWHQPQWS